MAKCRNCRLEVLDETEVCPLCLSILEQTVPVENMYPNARVKMRRLKIVSNIYLFLAICLEAALVGINIIAVEGGKKTNVSPAADYCIQAGDVLVVLGENYALEAVQKL